MSTSGVSGCGCCAYAHMGKHKMSPIHTHTFITSSFILFLSLRKYSQDLRVLQAFRNGSPGKGVGVIHQFDGIRRLYKYRDALKGVRKIGLWSVFVIFNHNATVFKTVRDDARRFRYPVTVSLFYDKGVRFNKVTGNNPFRLVCPHPLHLLCDKLFPQFYLLQEQLSPLFLFSCAQRFRRLRSGRPLGGTA